MSLHELLSWVHISPTSDDGPTNWLTVHLKLQFEVLKSQTQWPFCSQDINFGLMMNSSENRSINAFIASDMTWLWIKLTIFHTSSELPTIGLHLLFGLFAFKNMNFQKKKRMSINCVVTKADSIYNMRTCNQNKSTQELAIYLHVLTVNFFLL